MMSKQTRKINYIFIFFVLCILPLLSYLTKVVVGTTLSPDTMFFYSPADLVELASIYGTGGGIFYMFTRLTFDLIWPVVYLSFILTQIKTLKSSSIVSKSLRYLLIAAVLFDISENLFCSIVLLSTPLSPNIFVYIAVIASGLKWITLGIVIIGLILFKLKGIFKNGTIS